MTVSTDRIRNVVLVGHNGNGKTSLAEALLYRAGKLGRPGQVEQGTTVCDSDPEEKERQQSLSLATTTFEWNGHKINLIDTPGYVDFTGDALLGLYVAELAVFVIDGVAGVQPQDIVLWRQADKISLPRMVFINKLDRDNSSFDRTLQQVRAHFGSHADPVELPIGEESSFHGVTDLLTENAFLYDSGKAEAVEIPDDLASAERAEHDNLVEEVIEMDDALLEKYLDGTEPSPDELENLLHEAMDAAKVFPVLCGSATTPIGADQLADIICRVGPAPGDLGPTPVTAGDEVVDVVPDPSGDPLAFVFKTKIDDFLGQISIFKVLSGTIRTDDNLANTRTRSTERLHQLISLSGSEHTAVAEIVAGDIAAVTKLNGTRTGDTFSPDGKPVTAEPPDLPSPVYGVAIKAKTQAHEDRMANVLRRLLIEDPTLAIHHDDSTQQTVLSGNGATHIQVALSRLSRQGVEVDTEDVRVAHREALRRATEVAGKYKKQTGGHGQFGVAEVRFEPLSIGSGFQFDSEVTGGAIPRNLIPAVGAGIEEAMNRGGKYGFPVVDLRAVCIDGKHHSVDSSEMSFKMAGSLAFKAALDDVGTDVLEPVSEIWVHVSNQHQGDVLGDLNSRRAQVLGTEAGDTNDTTTIHAHVPTVEILRYTIDLRSMTGGTGTFRLEHHHYQPLPASMLRQFAAAQAEE